MMFTNFLGQPVFQIRDHRLDLLTELNDVVRSMNVRYIMHLS